ncbi:MAG: type II secretion system protein GspE, partial [Leptospiraceae bacterium]|nr:type II secretion system protein GspE [Leptospiraceae bacterium]
HTNDAPSAVTRLLDMGIEPYLIASTCRGFMAQRLLRKLCVHCRKPGTISGRELKSLGLINEDPDAKPARGKTRTSNKSVAIKPSAKFKIFEPVGCKECMGSGYRGRSGIYEMLVVDNNIRNTIIENPSLDKLREAAIKTGMQTLRVSALHKVLAGETSMEEAMRVT